MPVIDPLTLAAIGVVLVGMSRQSRPRFASLPVPSDAYAAALARNRAEGREGPGSPFGDRVDPLNPSQHRFHAGTDVRCPTGTPLLAVDAGTVVQVQRGTTAGNIIRYSTPHGRVSCMHLQTIAVDEGDELQAGQQIGTTGATGNVTGAHLHLELRPDGADSSVDPLPFFPV